MKELLLLCTLFCLGRIPAGAQNLVLQTATYQSMTDLQELVAPYFKTNPYNRSFSSFLQEIISETDLLDKVFKRRTDSTFFYASGTYKRYNPFIYRPTTLKLIIAESEFSPGDTSSYVDTAVYYQLIVSADSTDLSKQFVKKEYNRLLRKSYRQFTYKTVELGTAYGASKGEVAHCFIPIFSVSPLTVAWGQDETSRQYVFSISMRMKVQENRAGLVTLPWEPIRATQ